MKKQSRVYQIFYSKDIRKKKKVYSDGIMLCEEKKTKIYTAEGEFLVSVNNKEQPELDEEYYINNTYVVLIDKEVPLESFISGKIFMQSKIPPAILQPVKKKDKPKQSLIKLEIQIAKQFQNGLKIQTFLYGNLRPHQIQGVNFMYQCITGQKGRQIEGCILADFMGLGKTLQTLALIRSVIIQKIANKIVVVCPLTLLKIWQKQCLKWMGNKLSPLIAIGTCEEITKIIRMFTDYEYRFLVVSYENFLKNADALNKKCEMLIFDEGHRLKNKKSKLFKKIQTFKCKKRILLTGTPLQNNLDELYTCITLVNPFFFQSETVFKNVFQKPILAGMAKTASKDQRVLAVSRTLELAGRIKQFSLRRKADVLQKYLPIKRQYQIFLKITPLQQKIYDRIMKKKINDVDVLSFINLMRKLFTHPQLFKHDRFVNDQWRQCLQDCRQEMSYKMEFIKQIAQACRRTNQKLIIVSYFTETLDFIGEILKQDSISIAKLDGRVDGQDRYKIIQNFIRQKDVLLLSGKAGGTGLTLVCACKMIMVQPDWNPSNDSQVMGRIWRQGQQKQVQIYRLITGSSFQEKILQRQQLKQSLSEKLIDDQNNTKSYDFFNLKQLFMQINDKCVTYPQSDNKLEECKNSKEAIDWRNVIHVHINQSHEDNNKIENQFEEAVFEQGSEESQEKSEDDNLDQIDQRYFEEKQEAKQNRNIVCQRKTVVQELEIENQRQSNETSQPVENKMKEQIKNATIKLQQRIQLVSTSNQTNTGTNETIENKSQEAQSKRYVPIENMLPNVLRKFKKKLLKIDPAEQKQQTHQ